MVDNFCHREGIWRSAIIPWRQQHRTAQNRREKLFMKRRETRAIVFRLCHWSNLIASHQNEHGPHSVVRLARRNNNYRSSWLSSIAIQFDISKTRYLWIFKEKGSEMSSIVKQCDWVPVFVDTDQWKIVPLSEFTKCFINKRVKT